MDWLRQMLGLPDSFRGVIQDTASTATVCALVCAREKTTGFAVNERGFAAPATRAAGRCVSTPRARATPRWRRVPGWRASAAENVVTVAVDENYALDPADLERCIRA